jgi:hypothetical protein
MSTKAIAASRRLGAPLPEPDGRLCITGIRPRNELPASVFASHQIAMIYPSLGGRLVLAGAARRRRTRTAYPGGTMGTTTLHCRARLISRPLLTWLRKACCGLSWCWQGEQSIRFLVHLGALKRERLLAHDRMLRPGDCRRTSGRTR